MICWQHNSLFQCPSRENLWNVWFYELIHLCLLIFLIGLIFFSSVLLTFSSAVFFCRMYWLSNILTKLSTCRYKLLCIENYNITKLSNLATIPFHYSFCQANFCCMWANIVQSCAFLCMNIPKVPQKDYKSS